MTKTLLIEILKYNCRHDVIHTYRKGIWVVGWVYEKSGTISYPNDAFPTVQAAWRDTVKKLKTYTGHPVVFKI